MEIFPVKRHAIPRSSLKWLLLLSASLARAFNTSTCSRKGAWPKTICESVYVASRKYIAVEGTSKRTRSTNDKGQIERWKPGCLLSYRIDLPIATLWQGEPRPDSHRERAYTSRNISREIFARARRFLTNGQPRSGERHLCWSGTKETAAPKVAGFSKKSRTVELHLVRLLKSVGMLY